METRRTATQRWRGTTFTAIAAVAAALALASAASAKPWVPRDGHLYHGISDTGNVHDFQVFRKRVGAHPALLQEFFHWDVSLTVSGAVHRWHRTDTLGVVSLTTALPATGRPDISPEAIAKGRADHYLLRINEVLGHERHPSYIRLMPEMNGHWNPYCAFNADGSRRGPRYRTADFKHAWRRFVLIVRGGKRSEVNKRLRRQHLPRIHRADGNHDPVYQHHDVPSKLPRPRVAFMWVPQTFGSPNISGNQPGDYWPGTRFVDWVGADIFSKFASAFDDLQAFYRRYDGHPFVVGEYSPWDADPGGSFTDRLLDWGESHGRVRALIYYRSTSANNEFDINHYDAARQVLRSHLNHGRWRSYGPNTRD
jgi:hypothetical protein